MVRIDLRLASALVALLVAAASPAAADEQGSSWLGAVGDFVRDGLGPPRTIEDIRREEEAAREGKAQQPTPQEPPAPKLVVPAPPPAPVAPPAPVVAEPAPVATPLSKPLAEAKKPVAAAAPQPAAASVPVPMPRPATPVARAPVPPPPPEPLTSRIAATATLDQAVKLGGAPELYTVRVKKPVRN